MFVIIEKLTSPTSQRSIWSQCPCSDSISQTPRAESAGICLAAMGFRKSKLSSSPSWPTPVPGPKSQRRVLADTPAPQAGLAGNCLLGGGGLSTTRSLPPSGPGPTTRPLSSLPCPCDSSDRHTVGTARVPGRAGALSRAAPSLMPTLHPTIGRSSPAGVSLTQGAPPGRALSL